MRIYLDTNILIDVLENRNSTSYELIIRSLCCAHTIIISSWTIHELENVGFNSKPILKLFTYNKKVIFCNHTKEDVKIASALPTHFADALHYVLAKKYADALVTQNIKDFPFKDISIGKPEIF